MNSKGGCGKTTIATNLAAYYATKGYSTCLFDFDPQGSSVHWLSRRSESRPSIYGFAASDNKMSPVNSEQQAPADSEIAIIDSPAGVALDDAMLQALVKNTDTLLMPVLPSPIDIHACAHFIEKLLIQGGAKQNGLKMSNIGIIANRVKTNTVAYRKLHKFLDRLGIPFVASLNDAQNYVFAHDQGLGVHELNKSRNVKDQEQWAELLNWLDTKALEHSDMNKQAGNF
ncbi:ParA family protein [Cocleimonas flava]